MIYHQFVTNRTLVNYDKIYVCGIGLFTYLTYIHF